MKRKGFTLIEMLVVIGIIVVLIGASIGGYSKMTASAEKAKAQELVSNVATALSAYFQQEGCWPKRIISQGASDGRMDENVGLILAKKGLLSLSTDSATLSASTKLVGVDRFGVLTPYGYAEVKRKGSSAALTTKVTANSTVRDHILHFAVDLDGDGVIKGASVGGESVDMRATAAVWAIGKKGGNKGEPWPYKTGRKKGDTYSWSYGQTQKVN